MSATTEYRVTRLRSGEDCECSLCEDNATWRVEDGGKTQHLCADHYDDHVEDRKQRKTA